ncbi:MAG: TonB-dependent receptor, partial [Bacteroidetes bacterium]|nr:TonB-dependent receptor [Bacteroidota bacterium]
MKQLIILFLSILFSFALFAQNAQVKGKIIDASNNEPIGFSNVIVVGTAIGTTSDLDGNFIITGLKPGYLTLQASFIGYKSKLSEDILISNSNTPFIEIILEPSAQELSEFVIVADPFEKKQEAPLSMQRIGTKEIESNPGSNRDISKVIQSFPGVGSTPAFRNDVIIRGGGPSENRFFLDDIEIPVLNHFSTQGASGGPVGIINADFIQSVDFYAGSFPSGKYNALSGVLDFKLKEGNKDKTNLQATLGASETALTVDGPLGKKTSYIFSVRRSYLQFLFSAIGLPFLPTYNDYQLKLKTNFDIKNQLSIISLGSLDKLVLNDGIDDPDAAQEYILSQIPVNNQWSYTIGAVYKHFFDKGYHTFVLSRNMLNNEFYKYPNNDESLPRSFDYKSREIENKFRYEVTLREKGIKYNFGLSTEAAKYANATSQQIYFND